MGKLHVINKRNTKVSDPGARKTVIDDPRDMGTGEVLIIDEGEDDKGRKYSTGASTVTDQVYFNEENNPATDLVRHAQFEAVRRVLIIVLQGKQPIDCTITLFLLAYILAPELLPKKDLASLADIFGTSKQVLSYRLRQINKTLGLRGRSQKSESAVESYKQHRTEWHKQRKDSKCVKRKKT